MAETKVGVCLGCGRPLPSDRFAPNPHRLYHNQTCRDLHKRDLAAFAERNPELPGWGRSRVPRPVSQKELLGGGGDPLMLSAGSEVPTRSAIYMRVSKDDGSQKTDNQLLVLREEIERDGEELVKVYLDRETGTKGRRERSDFDRMFKDAERRRFDLLRFWALDRFSREGIRKTIGYLQRLDHLGVRFKSHTEPYLNTDNELIAHIVLGVTSYYAQLEAQRISDRTKAGLERPGARAARTGVRVPRQEE